MHNNSVYAIQRDSPINDYLLTSSRLHTVRTTLTQLSTNSGQPDEKAIAGLGYMVDLIDFVDSTFVKCWRNQCWNDASPTHISAKTVSTLLQRYTEPMSTRESPNDAQRADVLVTRHWICHILWDLGSRHGFLHKKNAVAQMRPDYALTIAHDSIDTCESLDMPSLECHGIGLVSSSHLSIDVDCRSSRFSRSRNFTISLPVRLRRHSRWRLALRCCIWRVLRSVLTEMSFYPGQWGR